jgi:hypothetical protein
MESHCEMLSSNSSRTAGLGETGLFGPKRAQVRREGGPEWKECVYLVRHNSNKVWGRLDLT